LPEVFAGVAGPGADCLQCLVHRGEDRRVLAHAEIIVRAQHRDLGADAVVEGARKPPAARSRSANTRYRPSVCKASSRCLKKPS
jgi:hypothetical protein